MDMKFVRRMGPSFMKLHRNAAMVLPVQDTRYTFLWSTGVFQFDDEARHPSGLIRSTVRDANFKYMVERIYDRLKRYLDHLRDRHQRSFEAGRYTQSARKVDVVGVSEEVVEEGVRVSEYRGQSSGEVHTGHHSAHLAHYRPGLPTFLLGYTATPRGDFREAGRVVLLQGTTDVHISGQGGWQFVKYKLLKPDDREAECGAFPLLYPNGQIDVQFDLATYLAVKRDETEEITDPNV